MQNHSTPTGEKTNLSREQSPCETTEWSQQTLNDWKMGYERFKKICSFIAPYCPWLIFSCYAAMLLLTISLIPNTPNVFDQFKKIGISAAQTFLIGSIYLIIAGSISSIYIFLKLQRLNFAAQKQKFIYWLAQLFALTCFTAANLYFLYHYIWYLLVLIKTGK